MTFTKPVLAAASNPLVLVLSKVIAEGFQRLPEMLRVSEGEPFRHILSEHKKIIESISTQSPEHAGELM